MNTEENILLSTLWNQYGKVVNCGSNEYLDNGIEFNTYMPVDVYISTGEKAYTGCVNTAISQIIYYHLENDYKNDDISYSIKLDVLNENDSYVSLANIPELAVFISSDGTGNGNTLSFDEINQKLSTFISIPVDENSENYDIDSLAAADYVAAMNFTIGVLNKSRYSKILSTGAIDSSNVFYRCNFYSANAIDFDELDENEASLWISSSDNTLTDEAIDILIENIKNGKVVFVGIQSHAIVLDGYDEINDLFHLNYGWGPEEDEESGPGGDEGTSASTKWYTREEFQQLNLQSLIIDIDPTYQETFTVTNSDIFGSGSLLRISQQALAMKGDNIIVFDENLANTEDVLELPVAINFQDNTTIKDFNMTIFAAEKLSDDENLEEDFDELESQDETNEEEKEEDSSSIVAFNGKENSRTTFVDFNGKVIFNTSSNEDICIFDFSKSTQFNLSSKNAIIFAGNSQVDNLDVIATINANELDDLLENTQIRTAISSSDGDDSILLDENTIVVGNLDLSSGHDSLTLKGFSHIYGDVDTGSGDNIITITAGSSIHGNINNEIELCMILDNTNTSTLIEITGNIEESLENILSITIDATNAKDDEYILFNGGNINLLLEKLIILGNGGIYEAADGSIRWKATAKYTPNEDDEEEVEETIILANQTISNATIDDNERYIFQDGSIATGSLSIAEDGEVKVLTGAKFIFDITNFDGQNENALIDNYANINGTFHYSIALNKDQNYGTYTLASNVDDWDFNAPISVNAQDHCLGTFSSKDNGHIFYYEDKSYTLSYDENNKSLELIIDSAFTTVLYEDNSLNLSWHKPSAATGYFVEIYKNDGCITVFTNENKLNIVTASIGSYQWQAIASGLEDNPKEGGSFEITQKPSDTSNAFVSGEGDDIYDLFIAENCGVWSEEYFAKYAVYPEGWENDCKIATKVALAGKNRYSDIYVGNDDDYSSIHLSDSANGDGFFLDDIYSAYPDGYQKERLSEIDYIYAGEGDDVIDLTSDKFEFSGDEIKIYGGNGNDVIWTNSNTASMIWGDKGDDSIIGSSKDDCLIGGDGNDIMHGAGGSDTFAYGNPETWGHDVIYQLKGEENTVILFFEDQEVVDKLRATKYSNGWLITCEGYENSSIKIFGESYSLVIGSDYAQLGDMIEYGGWGDFATEKVFENKDNGNLA